MTTQGIIDRVLKGIINPVIEFLFVLAFFLFLWGIFQFVANAGDEAARSKGKRNLLYGIFGMFVIVSAAGIVALIQNTVNFLK